ncbi:hypothetical protein MUP65_00060, partial [Patescibacteria group bacterium]|nr:hypothetical protein [Patescibacteria group bacterium]
MPLLVSYFLSLFVFVLMSWLFLYLPGFWLVTWLDKRIKGLERFVLSLSLGMAFFVAFHLLVGRLGLRFISWPFFGLVACFTWRKKEAWREAALSLKPVNGGIKKKGWFRLILLVGMVVQLWINIFSGWQYDDGVRFWSAHGHDAVWHGGLMRELEVRFPPRFRLLSGSKLDNYHYYVDILMGEFHRLGGFDPMDLYFRHFTLMFAGLFLLAGFVLVKRWKDESSGLWAMFFMAFSGSFGYLVSLIQNRTIANSEAKFWVSQTYTAIGNPPQIIAFILFITFLFFMFEWLKKPCSRYWWMMIGLSVLIPGFKIYTSATLLGGLGLLAFYQLVVERRWRTMGLFAGCTLASAATFFSNTTGGSSFLVFQPWWFV